MPCAVVHVHHGLRPHVAELAMVSLCGCGICLDCPSSVRQCVPTSCCAPGLPLIGLLVAPGVLIIITTQRVPYTCCWLRRCGSHVGQRAQGTSRGGRI